MIIDNPYKNIVIQFKVSALNEAVNVKGGDTQAPYNLI